MVYAGWIHISDNVYYYWGGSRCPAPTYSAPTTFDLQLIADAAIATRPVIIYYKLSGGYRCYVGVELYYN